MFHNKYQPWFWTHIWAVLMALILLFAPEQWKLLTPYSGYTAVGFLVVTLSLNPIKSLLPKWIFITKLNRYRRQLGVAVFSYAVIHVVCFIIKRGGFAKTLPYLLHPAIIPVFFIALPILFTLTLTSNQYSIRKLTIAKWKSLHKKVYFAEIAIILHMILVGQKLWAAILFTPLIILQIIRFRKSAASKTHLP